MRADAAINGNERPLFFASTKVVAAVDAYLEERIRRGQGATEWTKYRGLDPHSRLFLTDDGHKMPIKVRALGNRKHHLCGVILDIYRKAFARAGFKGVSSLCARRTVAKRLTERGCDIDQIGSVLGLKERNSVRNLIPEEHGSFGGGPRPGLVGGCICSRTSWNSASALAEGSIAVSPAAGVDDLHPSWHQQTRSCQKPSLAAATSIRVQQRHR